MGYMGKGYTLHTLETAGVEILKGCAQTLLGDINFSCTAHVIHNGKVVHIATIVDKTIVNASLEVVA